MAPTTQRDRTPRPAPAAFLRRLGIRRGNPTDVFTAAFWEEVRRAGGDPAKVARHGGYSPEAGNVYFCTERIAKRSLSAEYDFFLRTLGYMRRLGDSLPPPVRVADLGGGTGVIGMYLAAIHPGCEVTVYDHSPAQLTIGRGWASMQKLRGVLYELAEYGQLAAGSRPGDCDLVLFLRGLDMMLPAPTTGDVSLAIPDRPPPRPAADFQAPVTAIANQLAPTGVAVIGCAWSGWGLVTLFEAIRRAGLGVDWSRIRCRIRDVAGRKEMVDMYVVVRPSAPRLARSGRDEARAFLNSAQYTDGPRVLGRSELGPWLKWFRDADDLLRAEARSEYQGAESVRLAAAGGYLLLEGVRGGESVWGWVDTLAGIGQLLARVRDIRAECGLRRLKVSPQLARFIRCCQLPDVGPRKPPA